MAMWEKVFVDPHGSGDEVHVALVVERFEGERGPMGRLRVILGPVDGGSALGSKSGGITVSGEMAEAVTGDSFWALLGERMEDC